MHYGIILYEQWAETAVFLVPALHFHRNYALFETICSLCAVCDRYRILARPEDGRGQ